MFDGWVEPMKLSIISFIAYSKGTTIFLKSVDESSNIKDQKYIYELLNSVNKDVMKENVVQLDTDNGSTLVNANKLLMKKFNIY